MPSPSPSISTAAVLDHQVPTVPPRQRPTPGAVRPTATDPAVVKRAVKAAALGNAMEWFDFGVYSYIAVTLGKVFFPSGNPTAQLLSTFGAFAAAFLVRPIGGMVFGPLGDRVGRQKILALTMIMMAAGTFAIGLIPSYAAIGVGAPLLLLAARLVQGFSTGGEYAGASTFIAEYAPDKRRGFLGSWLEFGTLAGYIGGAGLVTLMTALLSDDAMLSWGWRVPFLIAGPMGIIGLYLRMRLEETPAFAAEAAKAEASAAERRAKVPLREMIVGQWKALLLCVALVLVFNVTDYMLLSYMPSYLTSELKYDETHGLLVVLGVMALMMIVQPFAGALTDRVGRRPVIAAGCAGFLLLSVPALLLIRDGSLVAVALGMGGAGAAAGVLHRGHAGRAAGAVPDAGAVRVAVDRVQRVRVPVRRDDAAGGDGADRGDGEHDDARVLHDGRGRGRRGRRVVHDGVGGAATAGVCAGGVTRPHAQFPAPLFTGVPVTPFARRSPRPLWHRGAGDAPCAQFPAPLCLCLGHPFHLRAGGRRSRSSPRPLMWRGHRFHLRAGGGHSRSSPRPCGHLRAGGGSRAVPRAPVVTCGPVGGLSRSSPRP
ncbi:hypothetical protein GCM10020256_54430 [Streptomyces thermocoprophilus]